MHRKSLTKTDFFIHEKGGSKHSLLSGRQLRRLSERHLKKLGPQRSDLPTGITPTSQFF